MSAILLLFFTPVGSAVKRSDHSFRMVLGDGRFTADLARDDALHLAVVRSDLPDAVIENIDSSAARSHPGVHSVFTSEDLGAVPRIPIRVGRTPALESQLQPVLAVDRVRYVGEPVAVVVADSAEVAKDAADSVFVELDVLPEIGDAPSDSTELWETPSLEPLIEVRARYGAVDDVFSSADLVFESEFFTSRRTGLPVETRQLTAEWIDGVLHLWGVTKFVQFTRRTLAEFFDIEVADIVCHRVDVGGMFGVRGEIYPEDYLVPWVALITGSPVSWSESRREHLLSINHSGEQHHEVRIAVDHSGCLRGLADRVVLDMGAYARPIGNRLPHIVVETLPGPYLWESVDLVCRGLATSKTPVGTIRGPAAFETAFVRERMIDIAAHRLGVEPIELRRENLIPSRSIPHLIQFENSSDNVVYDSGDYPATLAEFERRIDYEGQRFECNRRQANGEKVGLGWALTVIHSGLGNDESVSLTLEEEGVFVLRSSASEVGQGLDRTLSGILLTYLSVPAEMTRVESSDHTTEGNGTFSSRSTIFAGNATAKASEAMRSRATQRAAQLLGRPVTDICLTPYGATSGDERITWKELAPLTSIGEFHMQRPTYGLALHVAQVSVDAETGEVRPERLWVGYDCGRAIDRQRVSDQLTGAAVAGLSGAIYERLAFEGGSPVSATLADYVVARASDVPDIEAIVFEVEPSPANPLGAKGAGEAGTIGAGAAIANAVANAIGNANSSISSLPLRPETVLNAMTTRSQRGLP